MCDDNPEVIVKGESHLSSADHEEELELIQQGVDSLIIEGSRERGWNYRWYQYPYGSMIMIVEYLLLRHIYQPKDDLINLAKAQGADVMYTRESNRAIFENAHPSVQLLSVGLFITLLGAAVPVGLYSHFSLGLSLFLLSGALPFMIIRKHESRRSKIGRDTKMAEQVTDAAAKGGRVVAVVGENHAKNISEHLPDKISNVDIRGSAHRRLSFQTLKDIGFSGFVAVSVLFTTYLLTLAFFSSIY